MGRSMAKVLIFIPLVIPTPGYGKMIKGMGRVPIYTLLVKNMLAIGKMIKNMVRGHTPFLMVGNWLVNSEKMLPGTSLITTMPPASPADTNAPSGELLWAIG